MSSTAALLRLDPDYTQTQVLSGHDDQQRPRVESRRPHDVSRGHADADDPRLRLRRRVGDAGEIPRVFARFTADGDRPDGAAVDSEGCYWTAFYNGAKVLRIAPDGQRAAPNIAVPAMCPTMCAFGGPDLTTLYVTERTPARDADDELARLPQSGGLFAMTVDVPGLPEPKFAG